MVEVLQRLEFRYGETLAEPLNTGVPLLSEGGDNIVRSIVFLARALNLRLIAEGVSKDLEVARLQRMKCFLFQGFYYSKAVPAATALDWLEGGRWPRGGNGVESAVPSARVGQLRSAS